MRVLWFTNTSSCYIPKEGLSQNHGYNGGGWISSAEKAIKTNKDIELAVSFVLNGQPEKCEQNGVTYYPIESLNFRVLMKLKNGLKSLFTKPESYENKIWAYYINQFKRIIEDFKPDIIQVWGSEFWYGLAWKVTDVPVVLHLQGILNPYFNAYNPPGISWKDIIKGQNGLVEKLKVLRSLKIWQGGCYREKEIFKGLKAVLGRTEWDKRVAYCLNPQAKYFHVDEILRDSFYKPSMRKIPQNLKIVTTISSPPYKGFDMVLKTAKILKENLNIKFEWLCYGNISPRMIEKIIGVNHQDVFIKLEGTASQERLREAELSATLYFHPSYIDNSPNSICEAQMLGLTVVAVNVGGISSLVSDGKDGFLVPANDPYQAAYLIKKLYDNPIMNTVMGEKGKAKSIKRHNPQTIAEQLKVAYKEIILT